MKCSMNTGSRNKTLLQPCSVLPANKQLPITLLLAKTHVRLHHNLLPCRSPWHCAGAHTISATDSASGLKTSHSDPHCHIIITIIQPDSDGASTSAGCGSRHWDTTSSHTKAMARARGRPQPVPLSGSATGWGWEGGIC